jgi:Carboxypeptidase regulatory-like domain/TonB-dependent Receptor Plug Domain/TonB dependent receptor
VFSINRVFVYLILIGLAAFLVAPMAWGQAATGRVIGTVFDQQGKVVPGAKVTVTNAGTQISNAIVTNKDGNFEVLDLPIGLYHVTVEHEGFNKDVTQDKQLQINQSLRFDITLTVGSSKQTVTVEAKVTGVETVNPTVGGTIIGEQIQQAPLNGRDTLQLALLTPGVTESNPDNTGAGTYSIAGGRTDSVTFLLDGALNNDLLNNGVVFDPNPDTIAEFRVLENNYSAEYGRNGGGIITAVTKSGTNDWHGSAYDFLRNEDLNANSYFNNVDGLPRDPLRRNQYGGTLGGPITIPHVVNGKNRFFFFVGYEGQRLSDIQKPSPTSVQVFTPAEIGCIGGGTAGCDFSSDSGVTSFLAANPFYQDPTKPAGFLNPAAINPVSANYITNGLIPSASSGFISPGGAFTDNYNELTMKFDFLIAPRDKLTATIGGENNPTLNPFTTSGDVAFANVPGFGVSGKSKLSFLNVAYTRTITSNTLNELRFFAQRSNFLQGSPVGPNSALTAQALGFTNLTPDNPTGPPIVGFNFDATTIGYTYLGPSRLVDNTFGVADTYSWTHGRHNWKFGAGFSGYQDNQIFDFLVNGDFDFNGSLTGNAFADFLLGAATDYEQASAAPSNIRTKSFYGFSMDEWHATTHLTLTLGLRYEYSSPKYDTEGRTYSYVSGDQSTRFPNAPLGLVFPGDRGAPQGVNFPVKNNWAPRVGFAWDPFGHGKTSIRGGFGIFYDILKAEDNFQFNGAPPFFSLASFGFPTTATGTPLNFFSDPFDAAGVPNTFPSKVSLGGPAYFNTPGTLPFGPGLFFVDPRLKTPYTYQYNLSVEQELVPNLIFEVNYLGSSSHGLTSLQDINPFVLGTSDRVFNLLPSNSTCLDASGNGTVSPNNICTYGSMFEFRNDNNANYNALTTSLTRQVANSPVGRLYFTFGYTYGHNIDTGSGFRQRNSEIPSYETNLFRTSSDIDVRNRITFSGGWDLPFDRMWESGPKRLTEGWSLFHILTWRTGFPLDVFADLPAESSYLNEGPSGAGDYTLIHANVVGPLNTLNPRLTQTLNLPVSTGGTATGHFWFDPSSFSYAQCGDALDPPPCTPGPTIFPSDSQVVANPSLATYGTLPRNFLRGPGIVNFDMSVSKTTAITERLKLQIRADFFNLFNHAEFANPDTIPLDGTFGQITNTGGPDPTIPGFFDQRPRIIQLGARFTF